MAGGLPYNVAATVLVAVELTDAIRIWTRGGGVVDLLFGAAFGVLPSPDVGTGGSSRAEPHPIYDPSALASFSKASPQLQSDLQFYADVVAWTKFMFGLLLFATLFAKSRSLRACISTAITAGLASYFAVTEQSFRHIVSLGEIGREAHMQWDVTMYLYLGLFLGATLFEIGAALSSPSSSSSSSGAHAGAATSPTTTATANGGAHAPTALGYGGDSVSKLLFAASTKKKKKIR